MTLHALGQRLNFRLGPGPARSRLQTQNTQQNTGITHIYNLPVPTTFNNNNKKQKPAPAFSDLLFLVMQARAQQQKSLRATQRHCCITTQSKARVRRNKKDQNEKTKTVVAYAGDCVSCEDSSDVWLPDEEASLPSAD